MAYSFGSQGSVPQTPMLPGLGGGPVPSTSVGKALNAATLPTPKIVPNLSSQIPSATTYGANSAITPLNPPLKALTNGTASLLGAPQTPQTPSYPGTNIPLVPPTPGLITPTVHPTSHSVTTTGVDGSQQTVKQTYPNVQQTQTSSGQTGQTTDTQQGSNQGNNNSGQTSSAPAPVTFPGLVSQIPQQAQGNGPVNPAAAAATEQVQELQKKIGDIQQQAAINEETQMGQDFVPQATGRAQQIAQTAAAAESGLGTQEQAAEQALTNTLAAQQQGTAGLESAATLAQPVANAPYFGSPLTGNTVGGGSGPAVGANMTQIGQLQQQVDSYSAARSAGNSVVNNQLIPFIHNSGVNPSDINQVNNLLRTIANNTSDPRYSILSNMLAEVAQTYSSVLAAPGQDPSVWTSQTAAGLLNNLAQGQSILDVINALDGQAYSKIQGYEGTIQALSGGQEVNPAPGSAGTSGSAFSNENFYGTGQ